MLRFPHSFIQLMLLLLKHTVLTAQCASMQTQHLSCCCPKESFSSLLMLQAVRQLFTLVNFICLRRRRPVGVWRARAAQSSGSNPTLLSAKCQRCRTLLWALSRFTRRKSKPFTADPVKLQSSNERKTPLVIRHKRRNTDNVIFNRNVDGGAFTPGWKVTMPTSNQIYCLKLHKVDGWQR